MRQVPLVLLFLDAAFLRGQVLLNEIMFDPIGPERSAEYVEIYNAGAGAVDLRSWAVGDGEGLDSLAFADRPSMLEPGGYAVIFDVNYFADDGYYDERIPADAMVIRLGGATFGSGGFRNSAPEEVILLMPDGTVADRYVYTVGNVPGFSDERVRAAAGEAGREWRDSLVLDGTPGAPNSVSPVAIDLALDPGSVEVQPAQPMRTDSVTLIAAVENAGLQPVSEWEAALFVDLNGDGVAAPSERVANWAEGGPLIPHERRLFVLNWQPAESGYRDVRLRVIASHDLRPLNNELPMRLPIGARKGDLVINEIQYRPAAGAAEWIELYNPGPRTIELHDWQLTDARSSSAGADSGLALPAGGYLVLADGPMMQQAEVGVLRNWPGLNNDADIVVIRDLHGRAIDSVAYAGDDQEGVSLERVSAQVGSGDPANWQPSAAPGGSTPGRRNSIETPPPIANGALTASPNPFSPDGDGRDDVLIIAWELPLVRSLVRLCIFDFSGRLVRTLLNNAPGGSRRRVVWDGRRSDGRVAPGGLYILYLEAIDAGGGRIERARATIALARRR